jgi:hypothetical protein
MIERTRIIRCTLPVMVLPDEFNGVSRPIVSGRVDNSADEKPADGVLRIFFAGIRNNATVGGFFLLLRCYFLSLVARIFLIIRSRT